MEDVIQIDDQWYVLATSSRDDERTRVLKSGETFGVFDRFGDISHIGLGEQGLYHDGTRYLSSLEFRINQRRPMLLNSSVAKDNLLLAVDLTTPDLYSGETLAIPKGTVHIFRSKLLQNGVCHEHIRLLNYGRREIALTLAFTFGADFADIFEVRGTHRRSRGANLPTTCLGDRVCISYHGLDNVIRRSHLCFTPAPDTLSEEQASYSVVLSAQQEMSLFIEVSCQFDEQEIRHQHYIDVLNKNKADSHLYLAKNVEIKTSNEQVNDWLNRSYADLWMLTTNTEQGRYPYAGVPWFSTPFGRDGLITARQSLLVNPGLARGVLGFLAAHQAKEIDPEQDAEPGKILHETRTGEMAALGEIPFRHYYGSVDATPLFIALAGAYYQRTSDRALIERIWPQIKLSLAWLDSFGDLDGDGFVEYSRKSSKGIIQQGWKDSNDSVFYEDGTIAEGPIALCEVQGYVYEAKKAGATLAAMLGEGELTGRLETEAAALKSNFNAAFWCEELETFALALDGKKIPCRVRSSNAGHALLSGIADPELAIRATRTLMSSDSFSGWGIRTLSSLENRYNPMSYHNGTIWPHDNSLIAMGFARYGFKDEAIKVMTGLFEASIMFDLNRLPELFCGFVRLPSQSPTIYPVACAPQAWSSGTVYFLLQACLGLTFSAEKPQLRFDHPRLPDYIEYVRLSNIKVANGSVDLALRRHTNDVGVNVIRKDGDVEIAVIV